MKYVCLPNVMIRFAILAAVAWLGTGPGISAASTIIVIEFREQNDNAQNAPCLSNDNDENAAEQAAANAADDDDYWATETLAQAEAASHPAIVNADDNTLDECSDDDLATKNFDNPADDSAIADEDVSNNIAIKATDYSDDDDSYTADLDESDEVNSSRSSIAANMASDHYSTVREEYRPANTADIKTVNIKTFLAAMPQPHRSGNKSSVELFDWKPSNLLLLPDQELLTQINQLDDDDCEARTEALNDYVESLGSEAQHFATMCEATLDIDLGNLSNETTDVAVFLASYRLYEQGELGMAKAAGLMQHSLGSIPPQWASTVEQMACGQPADEPHNQVATSESHNRVVASEILWHWIASRVSHSVQQVGEMAGPMWHDPIPGWVWKQIISGQFARKAADMYHAEMPSNQWKR